ncbi:MAG TPA: hypothetical protein VMI09_08755 [Candidatus Binataceae bacterium]|nr:hypothetical protein [Candidatus Binataceae bacterium]
MDAAIKTPMIGGSTLEPLFLSCLACDCCRELKPDVSVRSGLHPVDDSHRRTEHEFRGVLCDGCLASSRASGSKERCWLLRQLTRPGLRAVRRK